MSKLRWATLLVLAMAGIAAMYPIAKILGTSTDPYLLAFFRFFVAAIAILPIMAYRHSLRLPPKNEWLFFLFLGICAVIPTVCIAIGIVHTNSLVSAILINTNPLIVALLAPFLIAEHMTPKKALALAVGFAGVVFVVLNGHGIASLLNSDYFFGSTILMLGALLTAFFTMYTKVSVRKYEGLYVTFFSVALGSTILALVVGIRGGFASMPEMTPAVLASLLTLGIVATAIPYVIRSSSMKHLDAHTAASYHLLIPVFAAFYSFLFLSESFTVWMLIGLVLTSVGVYIVQREEKIVSGI